MGRWSPSYGYLQAATILSSQNRHEDSDVLSVPIYLLLGFQIELLLKAYLTAQGATDKELKDIGHDLAAALHAAEAKGYVSKVPIKEIVSAMSGPHKSHAFRYFSDAELKLYTIDSLIPILSAWDTEMHEILDTLCPV